MTWTQINTATPVLNTPDFEAVFGGPSGNAIPLNSFGHPKHFEFVALKGMRFEVVDQIGTYILQIRSPSYSDEPLYVDRRFCQPVDEAAPPSLNLSAQAILERMETRVGAAYVWGGNWADGVPEMLLYYPPRSPLDQRTQTLWTLQGLDCSGLLYEATHGATPRNTSHLLRFGRTVLQTEPLQVLDMILYPGHVLFVRDQTTIIESKSPFGVRICSFEKRWNDICDLCRGDANVGASFTIRRFLEQKKPTSQTLPNAAKIFPFSEGNSQLRFKYFHQGT